MHPKAAAAVTLSPLKKNSSQLFVTHAFWAILFFYVLILPMRSFAQEKNALPKDTKAGQFLNLKSEEFKTLAKRSGVNDGAKIYYYQYPSENVADENLGFRTPHNKKVRTILRTDSEIIFDAAYSFDQYGRRTSPVASPKSRKKFLLLSGCSFTFGYGLNDNQTLNYFLGKEFPDYFPYNYGIGASGPHTSLALLEEDRFKSQIPQAKGVMIYISLGKDHMDRATGRLPSLYWQQGAPYYEQDGDELIRKGSFASGRPLTTKFYFLVGQLFSFIGLENRVFPPLRTADSDYMCLLAAKMRDNFQKQYSDSRFIYYLHPFLSQPSELGECLTRVGVEWYEGRKPLNGTKWAIKHDGHPNAEANQAIAAEIASYIKQPNTHISIGNN
jgi:hypothetical protein